MAFFLLLYASLHLFLIFSSVSHPSRLSYRASRLFFPDLSPSPIGLRSPGRRGKKRIKVCAGVREQKIFTTNKTDFRGALPLRGRSSRTAGKPASQAGWPKLPEHAVAFPTTSALVACSTAHCKAGSATAPSSECASGSKNMKNMGGSGNST